MKNNKIEKNRKIQCGEVAGYVLGAIGIAGIVIVAVTMPNLFQVIPIFQRRRYSKKSVDQAFRRLQRRGLVKLVQGVKGMRAELTEKGYEEFILLQAKQKRMKRPGRWDREWRLLIFDIQEKRRNVRDAIRRTLMTLGFYRLQDSVWVYPYDCDDVLELLRVKYRVRHDALILTAGRFPKDQELCRHFGLKTC